MYHPITIFLIVLGLFCLDFFLLLCFLPREVPLAFVVQVVWWCWILLTFACLESFLFLHQIWTRALLGSFLGCRFFPFITSNISCYSLLACRVSVEKSAGDLMRVPFYVICCFSLAAFNILSLFLIFIILIAISLGVFLLGFILLGTLCTSWTWLTISFPMLGKFQLLPLLIFSWVLSLSLLLLGPL